MGASTSDGQGRTTILAQMVFPPRAPLDDIDREPMPPDRPSARAQWDEATGRWIEWDDVDHEWDPLEEPAADPSDEPG